MLTVDFNVLGVKAGDYLLDIGCGEGRHSFEACKWDGCRVWAVDICRDSLRKTKYMLDCMDARKELGGTWNVALGDAMSLPFKDGSFDKIICSEVLEHLMDDAQGVRELVRVLKDQGAIAVTIPTYLTEAVYWKLSWDYCHHPGGHVRKYKAPELVTLLRRNRLQVYAIRFEHALHSIYWLLRCIFGLKNETARIPALWYTILDWDIRYQSRLVHLLEDVCNYIFPKSIIIYARKIPR